MKHWLQARFAAASRFLERQASAHAIRDLQRRGLLAIGRHTYGRPKIWSYRGSECKVSIGAFCSISPGVQIISGGIHPKSWVALFPFRIMWNLEGAFCDGMPETRGEIAIGSDVWVGTDAVILSGVTIGHGAIVAARAVVTRNVEPYAIVAGSPARVLSYRFPPEVIDRLLKIAWWNWDDGRIREAVPLLSSPQIEAFLQKYDASAPA